MWHVFGMGDAADVEDGWEDRWRSVPPARCASAGSGSARRGRRRPHDALAVVVDPGRAFGTGAHPTTQLCLELLQELEPGSLLDVGCGSGVLSVAAALLGHAPVLAVDIEAPSIVATLENAARNGVELDARLVKGDEPLPAGELGRREHLDRRGAGAARPRIDAQVLLTSGYFLSEQPVLAGYAHVTRRTYDGWAADLYRRTTELGSPQWRRSASTSWAARSRTSTRTRCARRCCATATTSARDGADVAVISTCCVTNEALAKSRKAAARAARTHDRVYVTGCGANLGDAGFAGLPRTSSSSRSEARRPPRSSPATSARSAASRPTRASIAFARS